MIDGIVPRPELTTELGRALAHYSRIRPADPLLATTDEPGRTVEMPIPPAGVTANGEVRQ
jgi:hypothetical protein